MAYKTVIVSWKCKGCKQEVEEVDPGTYTGKKHGLYEYEIAFVTCPNCGRKDEVNIG